MLLINLTSLCPGTSFHQLLLVHTLVGAFVFCVVKPAGLSWFPTKAKWPKYTNKSWVIEKMNFLLKRETSLFQIKIKAIFHHLHYVTFYLHDIKQDGNNILTCLRISSHCVTFVAVQFYYPHQLHVIMFWIALSVQ